jgi:hypothetical protein
MTLPRAMQLEYPLAEFCRRRSIIYTGQPLHTMVSTRAVVSRTRSIHRHLGHRKIPDLHVLDQRRRRDVMGSSFTRWNVLQAALHVLAKEPAGEEEKIT